MAPISKTGKPYYTKEQYEFARYNTSALEYAQSQGYELVRDGLYYHMKEHDSMIFTPRGNWFWNSRGLQGGALEFQMYYEGKTITEAVLTLAEGKEFDVTRPPERRDPPAPVERQTFELPEKSNTTSQLFGYLCKTRKLDRGIVQEMLRQGIVYESVYKTKLGKLMHNACFVSYDNNSEPCSAYQRGTSAVPFKKEAPGSNKSFGWLLKGNEQPVAVMAFEAAIDAASYATILKLCGQDEKIIDYLALGGVGDKPLENYLTTHPNTREIWLGLDADGPGRAAAQRIKEKFTAQGYAVTDVTEQMNFGECKDWNELLQHGGFDTPVEENSVSQSLECPGE